MAYIFFTNTITTTDLSTGVAGARTRAMVATADRADQIFQVLAARGAG